MHSHTIWASSTVVTFYSFYIPCVQRSPVQPAVQRHNPGDTHVPPFAQGGLHAAAEEYGGIYVFNNTWEFLMLQQLQILIHIIYHLCQNKRQFITLFTTTSCPFFWAVTIARGCTIASILARRLTQSCRWIQPLEKYITTVLEFIEREGMTFHDHEVCDLQAALCFSNS